MASVPWKPGPALNHGAPEVCGAAAALWHIVPLKQPGAVPDAAGVGGRCGLFTFPAGESAWHP